MILGGKNHNRASSVFFQALCLYQKKKSVINEPNILQTLYHNLATKFWFSWEAFQLAFGQKHLKIDVLQCILLCFNPVSRKTTSEISKTLKKNSTDTPV